MRKIFLFLLPLLVFCAAFTVHAASANESIAVGQTKVTTVRPGETADYTFTPSEAGDYAFCLEETDYARLQEWVCLENGVAIQGRYYCVSGWEGRVFSLDAGKTYTFRVTCASGFGAGSARNVHLAKVSTTTTLAIDCESTIYVGESAFMHPIVSHPGAIAGGCQWSSSNSAVAYIEDASSIQASIVPVSPGTTTITLQMGGLSASYTLTVAPVRTIPIGGSVDVDIAIGDKNIFWITPQETGYYAVWNYHPDIILTVTNAGIGQGFSSGDDSRGWIYQLHAGRTYTLYAHNTPYAPKNAEDTIHVEKVRPVESISLKADEVPYSVGTAIFLHATTDPCYGTANGVTWTCSDPDVLQIQHNDYNSGFCEALILKPGEATVTVTVDGFSASWDFSMPAPLQWYAGQTNSMPIDPQQLSSAIFIPEQDGYYQFNVATDQDALFIVSANNVAPEQGAWQNCLLSAGKAGSLSIYLQKDIPYQLEIHGTAASSTLSGSIHYIGTDKPVSHITINSLPTAYEFGNEDYGNLIDGMFSFSPLGYQGMSGLTFTVHYVDGSSVNVSADSLSWEEYDGFGLTPCLWNGRPVEFSLLIDDAVPGDTIWLSSPCVVMARLRYMGVCAEVPLTVVKGHDHQMVFLEEVPATKEQDGIGSHYQCTVCNKYYFDDHGLDRVWDLAQLAIPYVGGDEGEEYIPDEEQLQDSIETMPSGGIVAFPAPEGTTSVVLSSEILQTLIQHAAAASMTTEHATVFLDSAALSAIAAQTTGAEIALQVLRVETEELTAPQQQTLEQYNIAFILSANIMCGETYIHDFSGGNAIVQIPFAGDPNKVYKVIYIADDGTEESIPCQYTDGKIEFTTGHFSMYAVVEDVAQTPSDLWLVIALGALILALGVAIGVFVICSRRRARK